MKQLFCVIYISVLLVCLLRLILHLFVFVSSVWRANQLNTNAAFRSLVGHFRYFITLSHCLVGLRGRTLPVRPDEINEAAS